MKPQKIVSRSFAKKTRDRASLARDLERQFKRCAFISRADAQDVSANDASRDADISASKAKEEMQILPAGDIRILADNREGPSLISRYLSELGAKVIEKNLEVGDFICSGRVVIERKKISDFLQSITDQRIFRQLSNLRESFECPVLMIEGNPELLFLEREIHGNSIRGVLAHIAVDSKIPIIWTQNSRESAAQIFWIARREQVPGSRGMQIRSCKKAKTHAQKQEFLVAGLPYVNTVLSRRLLKKFKTIKRVFNAKPERLKRIEGLGEEKAKKIWELINREYDGGD